MVKPITIAFDEYGVWDETVGGFRVVLLLNLTKESWGPGTPQNGLEQFYTLADALAMASWLNVFVRQADVVEIACIAQSVNVISPLITRYDTNLSVPCEKLTMCPQPNWFVQTDHLLAALPVFSIYAGRCFCSSVPSITEILRRNATVLDLRHQGTAFCPRRVSCRLRGWKWGEESPNRGG